MTSDSEDQRVEAAVRRHVRHSAFEEAEKGVSFVLSDPQVQRVKAQIEESEMRFGWDLSARLQPFRDRYDQAVRDGDVSVLIRICPGKHGRWGRICLLDKGHETSMEEPHWGYTSEGQPIAWVGSAPDDW